MNKIADFLVKRRYIVLIIMLVISVFCAFLIPSVEINADMTKYLPDNSSMRTGMELMEQEFPNTEVSKTIRVMFKGLSESEKTTVLNQLSDIEYVDSVSYDAQSEDYNKDDYTLYVINTSYDYNSDEELAIENALSEDFGKYDMIFQNDNTGVYDLPFAVIAGAVGLLVVILFIMCGSYFEPILFLATIGVAVVINLGTNIFMGSISSITFSIAAILQLALSMDYSIILMNRYRQERALGFDKCEAMKHALKNAFSSIVSSGMTTVVGLIMLVFMSYKIGMDLGIVLAKGVFISMICVFTVLSCLIVMFDKVIFKTSKKELKISMGKIASFSYRFRRPLAVVFALLFIATFFLQNITKTTYTLTNEDEIADIFPSSNPIVMLYENKDEQKVAAIASELQNESRMKSVINYSTIFNKEYNSEELSDLISSMGGAEIKPYMIDLIYYDYFKGDEELKITAGEFLNFLSDEVINNDDLSDFIDEDIAVYSEILKKFSDANALTKQMSAAELASFLGTDEQNIEQLITYYYILSGGIKTSSMTMSEFIDFLSNEVAGNESYSSMIDRSALEQIKMLPKFSDPEKLTAQLSYNQFAEFLGISPEQAGLLFVYYYGSSASYDPDGVTLAEFTDFMLNTVLEDPAFSGMVDEFVKSQLQALSAFTDVQTISAPLNKDGLSAALGIDSAIVGNLIAMKTGSVDGTMSIYEFVDFLVSDIMTNPAFSGYFDEQTQARLSMLDTIMQASIAGVKLNSSSLAQLFGMDENETKMLLTYRAFLQNNDGFKVSAKNMVEFLAGSESLLSNFEGVDISQIKTAGSIINAVLSGNKFTSDGIAELLSIDKQLVNQVFTLYAVVRSDTKSFTLSVKQLVDFLNSGALDGIDLTAYNINDADLSLITPASALINAVISGDSYSAEEMFNIIGKLQNGIDENTVELLYLYYGGLNHSSPDWKISINNLATFLNDDLLEDPRFNNIIDDKMRGDIESMQAELDSYSAQLKGPNYSILMLETTLPGESEETSEFLANLTSKCESLDGNYYLIGNSPMNFEMEQNFGSEMLLITLLTAISIFIVVMLTFRSLLIPLILVLIVQCGVYVTVSASGLMGYSIYYLALVIVQCILMGATIDYGILFTNYYREKRKTMDIKQSLTEAYNGSIHTILTSGLILIIVTGIIGFSPVDPTVGQICQTISIGALSASLLILFILPGLLATFDKFIVKKDRKKRRADKEKR